MRTYIEKKDGYVFLVQENDAYGRFNTYHNMGKDIDDPRWHEKVEEITPKKKKNIDNKKEEDQ